MQPAIGRYFRGPDCVRVSQFSSMFLILSVADMSLLALILSSYLSNADLPSGNEIVASMNLTDDSEDYMVLNYGKSVSHMET